MPWRSVADGAAVLLSAICTFVLNAFRSAIKDIGSRVEKLEADRGDIQVLTANLSNLTTQFRVYSERMEAHHRENRETATADREETAKWRSEVMGPVIQKLVTDVELSKERILELQKRRRTK